MGYVKVTLVCVLTLGLIILDWYALSNIIRGREEVINDYITLATTTPIMLLVIYFVGNDSFSR